LIVVMASSPQTVSVVSVIGGSASRLKKKSTGNGALEGTVDAVPTEDEAPMLVKSLSNFVSLQKLRTVPQPQEQTRRNRRI
jgi:hypothetical protein